MTAIARLSAEELLAASGQFAELLMDVVDGGASLGFLAPLAPADAAAWWESLAPAVDDGQLRVWAAQEGGRVVGTVSLRPELKANGRHRAEVTKLMVHRDARGRGVARRLLAAVEGAAAETGLSLLVLDTETGSPAERLYRAAGWTQAGIVPGYASDPAGVLRPTTIYFKALMTSRP
ncbi:MAG TPA: GNAT family N-acetyltransferase [Actinocrinis sp.]|nr:GNAT family N-acetyltransferase [Actinocrinis sp.]